MHLWKYKYDERRKGIYYDRYEQLDIIKYRKKWLERMFEYQKYMKVFDGNILNVILKSQLKPKEKELI